MVADLALLRIPSHLAYFLEDIAGFAVHALHPEAGQICLGQSEAAWSVAFGKHGHLRMTLKETLYFQEHFEAAFALVSVTVCTGRTTYLKLSLLLF